ncbi:MAG TPA: PE-PPE domain-containing protein, partial [Mycobacterium sp.]|nr:PE-PPE domain-containing protein [Mycobacterium sp.]
MLAVAVSAALAAAWTVVVAAVTPLAAVTALVMGGTGMPLLNTGPVATPDAVTSWYLGWTKNTYITPSLRAGDSYAGSVAVYTPEEFWPLPDQQLTFDESVGIGLVNLAGCAARGACTYNTTATGASSPDGAERFLVFGYSQSARVATNLKRALIATHNAAGDWATVPALDFVLIGNPNRPNGGILERFAGLSIPFFGISFDGATPTDSDCANGCKFATADYSRQSDGYS